MPIAGYVTEELKMRINELRQIVAPDKKVLVKAVCVCVIVRITGESALADSTSGESARQHAAHPG